MNKQNTVITLGPKGSYSSIAAENITKEGTHVEYNNISKDILVQIPSILNGAIGNLEVIEKIPGYMGGVIPMHNKYGRNVVFQPEALYNLKKKYPNTKIIGWYSLKIKHVLATKNNSQKIKKIYSHPQAIIQCKNEIGKMQDIETIGTPSTTSQIEILKDDEAVICNEATAKKEGLFIRNKQFAPDDNHTDFALVTTNKDLTAESFQNLINHKLLLILSLPDKKGSLVKNLSILEKYNINMSSIHSHPNSKGGVDFPIIIENHQNIDIEGLKKNINIEVI